MKCGDIYILQRTPFETVCKQLINGSVPIDYSLNSGFDTNIRAGLVMMLAGGHTPTHIVTANAGGWGVEGTAMSSLPVSRIAGVVLMPLYQNFHPLKSKR